MKKQLLRKLKSNITQYLLELYDALSLGVKNVPRLFLEITLSAILTVFFAPIAAAFAAEPLSDLVETKWMSMLCMSLAYLSILSIMMLCPEVGIILTYLGIRKANDEFLDSVKVPEASTDM